MTPISFRHNGTPVEIRDLPATTTLLRLLRDHLHLLGTKEGCAEGDCGACTVVISDTDVDPPAWRAVDACLMFLPMLQGRQVWTVEGLRAPGSPIRGTTEGYHLAQQALVETRGSQCGYCTPGVVMSLVEATYREDLDPRDPAALEEQMAGNLCRCTGYGPIREAAAQVAGQRPRDHLLHALQHLERVPAHLEYEGAGQRYLQPATLEALWAARAEHPEAVLVAGGTDVALEVTRRHRHFPVVIGLEAIPDLKLLSHSGPTWTVGAGVTLTLLQDAVKGRLPALEKMLRWFGARQIRNRGTVGGNLCNASPVGDLAPVLLALDAVAVAAGPRGTRKIPLDAFFTGYRRTALEPDEILLQVGFATPDPAAFVASYKVSRRRELDISSVSAGMTVLLDRDGTVRHLRLAYGGVAPTPVRALHTERALVGRPWSAAEVRGALDRLEEDFTPISDHRGSERYRRLLARNLLLGFALESTREDRDRVPAHPTATVTPPPRALA